MIFKGKFYNTINGKFALSWGSFIGVEDFQNKLFTTSGDRQITEDATGKVIQVRSGIQVRDDVTNVVYYQRGTWQDPSPAIAQVICPALS